jgi:hypothetical protein
MEHRWNETDWGKRSTRGRTCPSATLSTINPTWIDPGSNPCLRGDRPATNRLSHGTASLLSYGSLKYQACMSLRFAVEEISDKLPSITKR